MRECHSTKYGDLDGDGTTVGNGDSDMDNHIKWRQNGITYLNTCGKNIQGAIIHVTYAREVIP